MASERNPRRSKSSKNSKSCDGMVASEFVWTEGGGVVAVAGEWDGYQTCSALRHEGHGIFSGVVLSYPGRWRYYFFVDGIPKVSSRHERDESGMNVRKVHSRQSFEGLLHAARQKQMVAREKLARIRKHTDKATALRDPYTPKIPTSRLGILPCLGAPQVRGVSFDDALDPEQVQEVTRAMREPATGLRPMPPQVVYEVVRQKRYRFTGPTHELLKERCPTLYGSAMMFGTEQSYVPGAEGDSGDLREHSELSHPAPLCGLGRCACGKPPSGSRHKTTLIWSDERLSAHNPADVEMAALMATRLGNLKRTSIEELMSSVSNLVGGLSRQPEATTFVNTTAKDLESTFADRARGSRRSMPRPVDLDGELNRTASIQSREARRRAFHEQMMLNWTADSLIKQRTASTDLFSMPGGTDSIVRSIESAGQSGMLKHGSSTLTLGTSGQLPSSSALQRGSSVPRSSLTRSSTLGGVIVDVDSVDGDIRPSQGPGSSQESGATIPSIPDDFFAANEMRRSRYSTVMGFFGAFVCAGGTRNSKTLRTTRFGGDAEDLFRSWA